MLFEDEIKPKIQIERAKRGSGTFVVVRVRNREDLNELADKLDIPYLKTIKKGSEEKIVWHSDKAKRGTLDDFFGE
jgi:hypothetical protein